MTRGSSARRTRSGARDRALVDGRLLGQRVGGNFRGDAAVMQHAQHAVGGDAADLDGVESPLAEDGEDFVLRGRARRPAACAPAIR